MKVLATYNIKGGVGKTAAAVNLAWLAASEGARILVFDLDPQGAASFYFRVKPKVKGGAGRLVRHRHSLRAAVRGTDFAGLDLVPADFSFRNMDLALDERKRPERRLERLLEGVARRYDFVFLDCPPSISLVSENVFRAADALLVPLIPTFLSLRTHNQLLGHLASLGRRAPRVLPFFSMVDSRKRLHRETVATLQAAGAGFLRSVVPYASEVELMGSRRAPLPSYAPASRAARAYAALWQEVLERL
jgi:chromosome partitioning protein